MKHALEVCGLKKSYGSRRVLKGLDFQVRPGEIFALLGANGAGKTTALECIEGLRSYDAGHITRHGSTGVQLQSSSLPDHIRPMEAVRLFAAWNRTSPSPSILEALGIPALGKKQYRHLSTGQKRRLHLALALTGDPDILFLDEPTAGLDVEGLANLHELIRRLKRGGKTILLASHDMNEVEALCDRMAILKDGILAFTGTAADLSEKLGRRYNISIRTSAGTEQLETSDILETLTAVLERCRKTGTVISDLHVDRGSLEQHFMQIAKEETNS